MRAASPMVGMVEGCLRAEVPSAAGACIRGTHVVLAVDRVYGEARWAQDSEAMGACGGGEVERDSVRPG